MEKLFKVIITMLGLSAIVGVFNTIYKLIIGNYITNAPFGFIIIIAIATVAVSLIVYGLKDVGINVIIQRAGAMKLSIENKTESIQTEK